MTEHVFHYTDKDGWNGIRSQVDWIFKASTPPGDHETGAYFTQYAPTTPKLEKKLLLPKDKREYVFHFIGLEGLIPGKVGRRRRRIFISLVDYRVERTRQRYNGLSDSWEETST